MDSHQVTLGLYGYSKRGGGVQYSKYTIIYVNCIDISHSVCYSKEYKPSVTWCEIYPKEAKLRVTHKSITLPVPPGATKEWVKAQGQEMVNRLLIEVTGEVQYFKIRKQWTDKARGRWMTVILDIMEYDKTD